MNESAKRVLQQLQTQIANSPLVNLLPEEIESTPVCNTCADLGQTYLDVPVGHALKGKLLPCPDCQRGQALQQRIWDIRFRHARLPRDFQTLTFAEFLALDPEHTHKKLAGKMLAFWMLREFVDHPQREVSVQQVLARAGKTHTGDDDTRNSILLSGAVGVGKTGLASAAMNALLERGVAVLYQKVIDMLDEIRATYDDTNTYSESDILTTLKDAPVLFLDDMNVVETPGTAASAFAQKVLVRLIRHRADNHLPTLITTNLDRPGLVTEWGERTADVVFAMAHWVPVTGTKLRKPSRDLEVF